MYVITVLILLVVVYFSYQYWKYKASDHGAPFVTMDHDLVETILRTAKVNEADVVYDLGSGDGRIPIMAALKFNARAVGIEIDLLRYYYSLYQRFLLRLNDKVTFLHANMFSVDLSPATIVVMYLLQDTNERLTEKLLSELKPGTIIISGAFNFPHWTPTFVDKDHETPFGPIYYYEIGKSNITKQPPVTSDQVQQTTQDPPQVNPEQT